MPTETTTSDLPPWLESQMMAYLDRARSVADTPYQQFQGPRVAPITPEQQAAMDMTAQRAMQGSAIQNQGQQALSQTLSGQYQNRQQPQVSAQRNLYEGQSTPVGSNRFSGSNPYLEDAIRASKRNSIEDYRTITAAQNDAAFSRAGGLGGSAYNEWTARNAARQAEQLGNIETGMRMQDYGQQAQLAESDINRRLGASQQDLSRNAGLYGDYTNQGFQAQQFNANQGNQAFESERQRQMSAIPLAAQYGQLPYQDAAALGQVGQQRQALGQQQIDANYQQYQQAQQYPWQQVQNYGQALGFGGTARTQGDGNATSMNPWAATAGGALAGYGSTNSGWGALAGGLLGYYGSR
jgi:hypothetical protein